jgi:ParB-like chromosome segregation protein Spo0J
MSTNVSHIKDLQHDPKNRRKHNPRNIGMLVDALQKVGAARSIVIDEHGEILAGNGVVEAAAEAGLTNVQVVDVDGQTVVAVRRTGLTAEQKRALAIFDNRVAELAEWDFEQLAADREVGLDLQPFWSENEEAKLFDEKDEADAHWKGMPEFSQANEMPFRRIIINFKNQDAVDAFSRLLNQTVTPKTRSVWYPAEAARKSTQVYVSAADE